MSKEYLTSDLGLSGFLICLGHRLVDVRPGDRRRQFFVFRDNESLQTDVFRWANDEKVSIKVRSFVNGLRDLKGVVSAV